MNNQNTIESAILNHIKSTAQCPECGQVRPVADRYCSDCGDDHGRRSYNNVMAGLVVMPGEIQTITMWGER